MLIVEIGDKIPPLWQLWAGAALVAVVAFLVCKFTRWAMFPVAVVAGIGMWFFYDSFMLEGVTPDSAYIKQGFAALSLPIITGFVGCLWPRPKPKFGPGSGSTIMTSIPKD